ncbi:MAG TPA: fumarate reductase/succinate dehydrogenase flavoprotein subunit [Polyangiaceae bacterium]|jgi:succinate dehydrogenase / fumarate reductase flavoprotein subunit|nr:fumarate reductase/succinate dehydrogenase flavoprotein subunit [Polyangiaceae bacterium]
MNLDARVPPGPLAEKWTRRREELGLVGPVQKRRHTVVVVGSGLAGASAAATLSELGYRVVCLCFQDSPRRAHSVAAQGGINAAKNYQSDGDSVARLFLDTLKGGDFRSREANVYRLAELSNRIIDHAVAQGVPFAREYGGLLANRSFGGALVSRTFYARGQTGQQLLLGAYQALSKEAATGGVTLLSRREMLDLVVVDGHARGILARNLVDGSVETHLGDAVVLATGGYANAFHLSTNAIGSNATAIWRAYVRGAAFANPCFVQFHPTCLPVNGEHQSKLTLMSESLRNDGRVWVPLRASDGRKPSEIPETERDYYLERLYPRYGNLAPRDIASRAAKAVCDQGRGVAPGGRAVYLDLGDALARSGAEALRERYGNLFEMYERLTGDDPLGTPLRIYPAAHYSMGGLWVDYDLMTTVPGLFAIGEANFSDHGANRLGASALMQALADGYFIVPYSIGGYLAGSYLGVVSEQLAEVHAARAAVEARTARLLGSGGRRPAVEFHRELGSILWESCGLARNAGGLASALVELDHLTGRFWEELSVPGSGAEMNQELERAGRVADFLELGRLLCTDALSRDESAGCHFREEHQTPEGDSRRDDARFAHVAVFGHRGGKPPERLTEPLVFEAAALEKRSYR